MKFGGSSSDFDIDNLAVLEKCFGREDILRIDALDKDDWRSLCTDVSGLTSCSCRYLSVSFVEFQLVDPIFEFLKKFFGGF